MSSIGEKLIKCRQTAKLSQREVAERLGIKTNTYGSWEADKTQPSGQYFPQLAEIFGVSLDKLFPDSKFLIIAPNQTNNDNSTSINAQEVKMDAKEVVTLLLKVKDEIIASQQETIIVQKAQVELLQTEVARLRNGQK